MKKLNIAILGYGVIGKGVFEICKNMPNINVVKILERKERFDQNRFLTWKLWYWSTKEIKPLYGRIYRIWF